MIKIVEKINVADLLDAYSQLENSIVWTDFGHKGRQTGLQYKQGDDPWTSSVGKSKGSEIDYSQLNPFFKDTIFEEIINKYSLSRTRLMWSGAFSAYSIHVDQTARIHVPIITNPACFFIFPPEGPTYMPLGNVYWADTRKFHTFVNCFDAPRLHLVGAVK